MSLIGFLVLLLIAALCGAVAAALVGFTAAGCLVSVGAGLIGAFVGQWLAAELGAPSFLTVGVEGQGIDIVWTIIGAMVVLIPLTLLRRVRRP